jgi:transketolase
VIDHFTYVLASDGDLMEGVASEAASVAGLMKLGKLICLYDDNRVSLAASTDLTFTEDRAGRFAAYGWHTEMVEDGNDLESIERALIKAREETERPSLIAVHTHIGYGSPHKQDTFEAHGSPLGEEEVKLTKQALGWPLKPTFYIPYTALEHFRGAIAAGQRVEEQWNTKVDAWAQAFPDLASELRRTIQGELPMDWDSGIPVFPADSKGMATRVAFGKVMNALASRLPELLGGSADLDPSTHTALAGQGDFGNLRDAPGDPQGLVGGGWSYAGRNIHFGVREHGITAIRPSAVGSGSRRPAGVVPLCRNRGWRRHRHKLLWRVRSRRSRDAGIRVYRRSRLPTRTGIAGCGECRMTMR